MPLPVPYTRSSTLDDCAWSADVNVPAQASHAVVAGSEEDLQGRFVKGLNGLRLLGALMRASALVSFRPQTLAATTAFSLHPSPHERTSYHTTRTTAMVQG